MKKKLKSESHILVSTNCSECYSMFPVFIQQLLPKSQALKSFKTGFLWPNIATICKFFFHHALGDFARNFYEHENIVNCFDV